MTWWSSKGKRKIDSGAFSDVGRVRSENQDSFGRFPPDANSETREQLFIVADGMGGHAGGREASRAAVEVVSTTFFSPTEESVQRRLARSFENANLAIHKLSGESHMDGMGTTCTALAVSDGKIYLAHVGDSAAYLIDENGVKQLTNDHTVAEELLREAIISSDEASRHPDRHMLTRSMGVREQLETDVSKVGRIGPGQNYLLCSDGLKAVKEKEVQEIVLKSAPQDACHKLVEVANERGGLDNATAVLVRIS